MDITNEVESVIGKIYNLIPKIRVLIDINPGIFYNSNNLWILRTLVRHYMWCTVIRRDTIIFDYEKTATGTKMVKKKNLEHSCNILKINEKIEVFCGTLEDAKIIDNDYCLFVLGKEKFETITYLRECFYGNEATTGRVQRFYNAS